MDFNNISICQFLVGTTFIVIFAYYIFIQLPQFNLAKRFDRSFSTKAKSQALWLLVTIIITYIIILIGSIILIDSPNSYDGDSYYKDSSVLEYSFALMLDPGQIDHLKNNNAHIVILFLALLGVITITGFTISTITNMVQRRVNQYLNGEIRYNNFENHIVIIGFGEIALAIIDQICKGEEFEESPTPIIVMSNQDSKEIRQTINTIIDKKNEKYIYVYRGRKDSGEDLDSLMIENAKEVFLLGEKVEYNRDATNMESLRKIAGSFERLKKKREEVTSHRLFSFKEYAIKRKMENWDKRKQNQVPITILFDYQSTYTIFQVTDLSKEWNDRIEFRPFNFYENWAKKLLYNRTYVDIDRSLLYYPALDGSGWNYPGEYEEGINEKSEKFVHLVIFGMSNMGEALGIMAAQMCHFPNFINDKSKKTIITFITPNADKEMLLFKNRYAHLFEIMPSSFTDFTSGGGAEVESEPTLHKGWKDLLDIKFEFIKGKAEQKEIRGLIEKWAKDSNRLLSIAVCLKEPEANMEIGLYLPDIVYEKEMKIPVFIRQKSSGALLSLLKKDANGNQYRKYSNVYPFGMLEDCYDLTHKDIETAKLFDYYYGDQKAPLTRENLDKKWNKLKIAYQWSNLYITYSIPFKLHSLGIKEKIICESNRITKKYELRNFQEEETMILARVEQNRWMVEKLLLGYRALHPDEYENLRKGVKGREDYKKIFIHPDICPYDSLDEKSLGYNATMSAKIPAILRHLENNDIK